MIELGRTYRDRITGFKGVATGFVQYISGCNQALLAPSVSDDGAFKDPQWIDEQRLTEEDVHIPPIKLNNQKTPGFDRQAPKR